MCYISSWGRILFVTDVQADRIVPQGNTHTPEKVTMWTKWRVWPNWYGAVIQHLNNPLNDRHTYRHMHTSSSLSQVKYDINNAGEGGHQVSWKVVRVNSNGSCRHRSVGTFKVETLPSCAFFSNSQPSNRESGSFHVLCLNNRCMINQMHTLISCHCMLSNMLFPPINLNTGSRLCCPPAEWRFINVCLFKLSKTEMYP